MAAELNCPQALAGEADLAPAEIGDNEPYDGALQGDVIDDIATARGLANALIEVRQDLISVREDAKAWADRVLSISTAATISTPLMTAKFFA